MPLKIAFLGAGSVGFTRRLVADILTVPEFQDARFAFHDISRRNLDMIGQIVRRDIRENGVPAVVVDHPDRKKALEGADYVISCVRIGGLEAFRTDINIPLKYGVDQCVGDTLCIGGIMYGQRNIAAMLDFCADIRDVAADDCLFLNYANPNAMNTWAANHYGDVPVVGLCHGVEFGHRQIAQAIEYAINPGKKPGGKGYRAVDRKEVEITCAGINHQTWFIRVVFDGEDWRPRLYDAFVAHPTLSREEKIRIDILKRFGFYSTESNGHLSEYLAWYRKRPAEIRKWIDMSRWILGESGGYLRYCLETRNDFETDFPKWLKAPPFRFVPENRSAEHGSYIIEALETGRCYRDHLNVVNNGAIANLPDDCIVEVPCYVDRNGISVPRVGNLPTGCAAICSQSVWVQRLAVEAAIAGDVELLKQAAMMDPLTGAVCTPPEISRMVDEMLVAQAKWLPQYAHAVKDAKKRLAKEQRGSGG